MIVLASYDDIKRTSTIQELIRTGKYIQHSADKLHLKNTVTNKEGQTIIFNIYSVLDRYLDELQPLIEEVTLSDDEFVRYRYQPKRICIDLYNCADLAPLVLKINNMLSVLEFNKQTIKLFRTSITDYLHEVLILENEKINLNSSQITKTIDGTG